MDNIKEAKNDTLVDIIGNLNQRINMNMEAGDPLGVKEDLESVEDMDNFPMTDSARIRTEDTIDNAVNAISDDTGNHVNCHLRQSTRDSISAAENSIEDVIKSYHV